MDYLIKMGFSFSAPACTCFVCGLFFFVFLFFVPRVVSIDLPQIETTTQSEINPRIIYGSRRLIKRDPAPNRRPPDRFNIDFSAGTVGLDNFFHIDTVRCPFPSLSSLRLVGAAEGSGHGGREELAGDLGQRGDHDGGLLP